MEKTMLENPTEISPHDPQLFDNPLSHGILTKDEVAQILRKKSGTIIRMANCGVLPCHYVGDTMMFYYHEIVNAFLSDRLANRRRIQYANHSENQSEENSNLVRGSSQDSGKSREQVLQELARSFDLDQ